MRAPLLVLAACCHGALAAAQPRDAPVEPTDVVSVNSGGRLFTTQLETLQASPVLAAALAGTRPWPRDRDGLLFLDFEPELFTPLLSFLRQLRTNGGAIAVPQIEEEQREQFLFMVSFLGLRERIYGRLLPMPEQALNLTRFGRAETAGAVDVGPGRFAMRDVGAAAVAGQAPLLEGRQACAWRVELGKEFVAAELDIGVQTESNRLKAEHVFEGKWFRQGSIAIFQLDADERRLYAYVYRPGRGKGKSLSKSLEKVQDFQSARFYARAALDRESGFELRAAPASLGDLELAGFL